MQLPLPRGPASAALFAALGAGAPLGAAVHEATRCVRSTSDAGRDEDLQICLLACYELHYRGLDGVDDDREWDPEVVAFRRELERGFERDLRAGVHVPAFDGDPIDVALAHLVAADDGPSLSRYVQRHATLAQVREFVAHRSIYQLKEADPHSWGIPRLPGRAKAALVEVQFGEYGEGRAERMHATLFAATMRRLELDDAYGGYADVVPATTLATVNLMSLFGLNRRWRGALVGHLAAFEMTSSIPNRRYADGLRRLGCDRGTTEFFDEHVEADAVHEQLVAVDLCGALVATEPPLRGDVLFGAATCLALDARFATELLTAWNAGASSLLPAHTANRGAA
jgi:hypothetical protein